MNKLERTDFSMMTEIVTQHPQMLQGEMSVHRIYVLDTLACWCPSKEPHTVNIKTVPPVKPTGEEAVLVFVQIKVQSE